MCLCQCLSLLVIVSQWVPGTFPQDQCGQIVVDTSGLGLVHDIISPCVPITTTELLDSGDHSAITGVLHPEAHTFSVGFSMPWMVRGHHDSSPYGCLPTYVHHVSRGDDSLTDQRDWVTIN